MLLFYLQYAMIVMKVWIRINVATPFFGLNHVTFLLDDSDIEYETLDFNVMSNMNDVFIVVSGMDYLQSADSVKPTALVS